MKEEQTVERKADEYASKVDDPYISNHNLFNHVFEAFIAGAKWKEEQLQEKLLGLIEKWEKRENVLEKDGDDLQAY